MPQIRIKIRQQVRNIRKESSMRTAIIASILLIGANAGFAQSPDVSIVSQTNSRPVNAAMAINKALHYLHKNQNADGSWGSSQKSFTATALALSAFLRMGETKTSPTFGETIAKAHDWLISAQPVSINDRIAVASALSDYNTLHIDTVTAQKVTAILQAISEPVEGDWSDILCATRLPDEAQRPQWCLTPQQVQEKNKAKNIKPVPERESDYLQAYVVGHAKLKSSRKIAAEHYHYLSENFLNKQREDGSFPVSVKQEEITATALVILSLADLNTGAVQFQSQQKQQPKKTGDQEITVTL